MSKYKDKPISPFVVRAADILAAEVIRLVKTGKLDARCPAADASLDYAQTRFESIDSINNLLKYVEKNYRPAK